MSTTLEHLEQRVVDLETGMKRVKTQVSDARGDAGAARHLAASADKDCEDFRFKASVQTQLIQALREIQVDHYIKLAAGQTELKDCIVKLQDGFVDLASGQEELREGQEQLKAGLTEVRQQVGTLTAGQAELKAGLTEVRQEVGALKAGQAELKSDVGTLKEGVAELKSDVGTLKAGMARVLSLLEA